LSCELFCPLAIHPLDNEEFDARVSIATIGPLRIAKTCSTPAAIERGDKHILRTPERRFALLMSVRGSIQIQHMGRDIVLRESDCILLDQLEPHSMMLVQANQAIGVQIPEDAIRNLLPDARRLCGRSLHGDKGLGNTVAAMVNSIWDRVEEGVPAAAGHAIAHSLLELVAASYAVELKSETSETAIRSVRKAQIRQFVEAHLRDSALNVDAIARFMGVSPRYARMVFADEPESVGAYILRRRLECCAELVGSPQWSHRTITEAAFEWGFSNTAHFSRTFKRHFGVSPREYRNLRRPEDHPQAASVAAKTRSAG
jgi:AraC-like DNA-binding protein